MKQPEVPSPLAREEGLSLPVFSPPPDGDTQVIDLGIDGPGCESGGYRGDSRRLGTHLSQLELEETPEGREPPRKTQSPVSAAGSLKELRNLLMVTGRVYQRSPCARG